MPRLQRHHWLLVCLLAAAWTTAVASAAAAAATSSSTAAAPAAPNFVVMFLDDHGYGDIGANGYGAETPHIDALAAAGMRFTDMHAMSVCTPSRASILTGRLGLRTGVVVNFGEASLHGLPQNETTIAALLKQKAYDTKLLGKWHLGHHAGYHPTFRGFDEYVGVPYSVDMGCVNVPNADLPPLAPCPFDPYAKSWNTPALPLYDSRGANCSGHASCNSLIVEQPVDLSSVASRYGDAAVEFISRHGTGAPAAAPFFLYVPFSHIHVPLAHAPVWTNASARKTIFADTLLELDYTIGRIVGSLHTAGVANNTLVLLTGDNGPWEQKCELAGSKGPFLGSYQATLGGGGTAKFTTWEGGHREAGIAYWPGTIPAGAVSNATVSTLDFLPTIAALAGIALPTDREFDGVDISSVLLAGANATSREFLFHPDTMTGNITAVRSGRYKAFFETYSAPSCTESAKGITRHDPPLIFDLESDPAESAPLASPPAGLVDSFKSAFAAKWANIRSTYRSVTNYSSGDHKSWPCCNAANVACRCFD